MLVDVIPSSVVAAVTALFFGVAISAAMGILQAHKSPSNVLFILPFFAACAVGLAGVLFVVVSCPLPPSICYAQRRPLVLSLLFHVIRASLPPTTDCISGVGSTLQPSRAPWRAHRKDDVEGRCCWHWGAGRPGHCGRLYYRLQRGAVHCGGAVGTRHLWLRAHLCGHPPRPRLLLLPPHLLLLLLPGRRQVRATLMQMCYGASCMLCLTWRTSVCICASAYACVYVCFPVHMYI